MKKTTYSYNNYRDLLKVLIESHPSGERGQRKALAQFLNCSLPYLTQVLSEKADFSLEQAESASRYFLLNEEESKFFICLVGKERAGNHSLKIFYEKEIKKMREEQSSLSKRLEMKNALSATDQSTYYSHWSYQAIHVLCGIPEFQEIGTLAQKLKLPIKKIQEIVAFLVKCGMLKKEGFLYKRNLDLVHLERDSEQILRMHSSWRNKVIESLIESTPQNLHYSLTFSCAQTDFDHVREELVQTLQRCSKVIQKSKDQVLGVLCLDLLKM